jgi:hypothetical protein
MVQKIKKKWYRTWWGILAIIFLFPIFLMVFASQFIWKQKWDKKYRIAAIAGLWIIVIILGGTGDPQKSQPQPVVSTEGCIGPDGKRIGLSQSECDKFNNAWKKGQESKTSTNQLSYEVLDRNENNTVENYKVLINEGDDGKAVAMEVKKACKKPCNISVFDNKSALQLDKDYDDMMGTLTTTPQEIEAWKQKNYVFVADHLVIYKSFELEDYEEYPYWDSYYKQLKGI